MADLVRFVDSIDASPTVRLDLNDEVSWWVKSFSAPPPRLRRAMSSNAMRDGVFVSSSQYEARTLTIELDLHSSTQDLNATELQKLARELDRADNFLMYQPTGATKPVFFKLFRSDMSQIENLTGASAFRRPTIELLAEPFALGLRETLGPYTVNNDPAAASNGCYFDVTGVIGDVAAPCFFVNSTRQVRHGRIAVRQHGTPADLNTFIQFESTTLGTDTTNPGGGPDAAMSGAGTNNYVTTSFATDATMVERCEWNPALPQAQAAEMVGRYRILAVVRRSDSTSVFKVKAWGPTYIEATGGEVTVPATTSRQVVDLGLLTLGLGAGADNIGGYVPLGSGSSGNQVRFDASRQSGAGTLDWDYFVMLPADEAQGEWEAISTSTSLDSILDGFTTRAYSAGTGSQIFTGGADMYPFVFPFAGSVPRVAPSVTNRFFFVESDGAAGQDIVKANTSAMTIHYWPRYLFVRPSAT